MSAPFNAQVDAITMARHERAELVALLESLTSQQWEAPTLCEQWRVRDVVAHMFSYDELSTVGALGQLLRNGMSLDRANTAGVVRYAGLVGRAALSCGLDEWGVLESGDGDQFRLGRGDGPFADRAGEYEVGMTGVLSALNDRMRSSRSSATECVQSSRSATRAVSVV